MAKPGNGSKGRIEKHGGYEPGPKTVSELAPPPKGPGAGAKPSTSGGSDKPPKK